MGPPGFPGAGRAGCVAGKAIARLAKVNDAPALAAASRAHSLPPIAPLDLRLVLATGEMQLAAEAAAVVDLPLNDELVSAAWEWLQFAPFRRRGRGRPQAE